MSLFKMLDSMRGQKFNFLERVSSIVPAQANLPAQDKIDVHGADSNYTLASNFYANEEWEQCYAYIKDAIKCNYKFAAPYVILADLFLKGKKVYEAQLILKKAIEYTGNISVHDKLAEIYREQGMFDKVVTLWTEYIFASPRKAQGYFRLANFYLEQRELPLSIQSFEKALELDPTNIPIFEKLAELYEFTEDFRSAIKILHKYMEAPEASVYFRTHINLSRIIKRIGNLYFRLREFDNAVPYYKKALDLIFNDFEVYMKLGDMCLITRNLDYAKTNYQIAFQLKDDDIEIMVKLGTLYFLKGEYEKSKGFYSNIIKFCSTIMNIHSILKSIAEGKPDRQLMSDILDENTDLSVQDLREGASMNFNGSMASFSESEAKAISEKIARAEEEKKKQEMEGGAGAVEAPDEP
ncbi:MAG: tetratricopeptide repeat protein, partial [Candidatus Wallbacteria bacterium]|nr:tetratricopeptide repeat protein [Candidatus Wallbacteria bacterium]